MRLAISKEKLAGIEIPKQKYQTFGRCKTWSHLDSDANWPFFGRNNKGWRNAKAEKEINPGNVHKLKQLFTLPGTFEVDNSPAIVDGIVYYVDTTGTVFAASAKTGDIKWTKNPTKIPTLVASFGVTVGKKAVYVAINNIDLNTFANTGTFGYALDIETGNVIWETLLNTLPDTLIWTQATLTEGGIVIFNTGGLLVTAADPTEIGALYGLNQETGSIIWSYMTTGQGVGQPNSGGSGVGMFSHPAIDEDLGYLYVGTGQNRIAPSTPISDAILVLNYRTGTFVWSYQFTSNDITGDVDGQPNPLFKDWDADSGPYLIKLEKKKDGKCKKYTIVLIADKKGNVYSLDAKKGKLLWQKMITNPPPQFSYNCGVNSAGCFDGKFLYLASLYSITGLPMNLDLQQAGVTNAATSVVAVDPITGDFAWRQEFPGSVVAPLTVANGVLYVSFTFGSTSQAPDVDVGGVLKCLDTKCGKLVAEFVNDISTDPNANANSGGAVTVYNGRVYQAFGAFFASSPTVFGPGGVKVWGL